MSKRAADGKIKNSPSSLYDTSWTLHRVTWPNNSEGARRKLSSQETRDRRARQLREFLRIDDVDSDDEGPLGRAGGLRECRWDVLGRQSRFGRDQGNQHHATTCGFQITLSFDKAIYKIILHGSHDQESQETTPSLTLCLAKAPMPLTKKIFPFLVETYNLTISPLRVPPSLLEHILETYLTTFTAIQHQRSSLPLPSQIVKNVIRDVRISLSFSAPISPNLRNIEIDVPAETMWKLPQESRDGRQTFTALLATHLHSHTGLILPNGLEMDEKVSVIRVSRVVCGAFVLSCEGRLKIVGRTVDVAEADQIGDLVERANERLIDTLVGESGRLAADLS